MTNINPLYLIGAMAILALAPFFLMMVTSYVKIIVVTSLVRNALGVQQIPPTMVMNGLAMILTIFIMAPVIIDTIDIGKTLEIPEHPKMEMLIHYADQLSPPLRSFLTKNSNETITRMFINTAQRVWPADKHSMIDKENLLILIPSFTISELTKSFQIGFLLYLAFITIDLIISNILLAMGMMMVSPTTISLPFKLLLFITLDGWLKISQGLILSYK